MIFSQKLLEQHIAILGKTGSGKTFTAKGIVEHLLRKGERVCVIDPVAAWWGLRSDASGKGPGFPVVIFGGAHGDVAIGGSHGAAVADIVAASTTSTVIDLKQMSVKDRTAFFTDFAVRIMQRNQGVLHMVIDEAHLFAPKGRVNSNQAGEMLSETNNLITGGRGVGFRFVIITQRPAKLHNDCLASAETLVAMRLTLGADRDAVETWIKDCASVAQGKEVLASLPKLPTGEGWVWSPEADILQRTKFPAITTFDSSNPNNLHRSNIKLSGIDVPAIRLKLEEAAGEIVNDDPVQLKRLLAKAREELRARVVHVAKPVVAPSEKPKMVEVPVLKDAQIKRLEVAVDRLVKFGAQVTDHAKKISDEVNLLRSGGELVRQMQLEREKSPRGFREVAKQNDPPRPTPNGSRQVMDITNHSGSTRPDGSLPRGEVATLTAACQYPNGVTRVQVSILTGYKRSSRDAYIQRLKEKGLVATSGDLVIAQDGAVDHLGEFEPLPTGAALRDYWRSNLPEGERAVFDVLVAANGSGVSRESIDEATGYKRSSRDAYIQRLKARQLVTIGGRGEVAASRVLFA